MCHLSLNVDNGVRSESDFGSSSSVLQQFRPDARTKMWPGIDCLVVFKIS